MNDPQTEVLLQRSADDLATIRLDGVPEMVFGFHAQQAVEKLLKALIGERGQMYAWKHDLNYLLDILHGLGESLPATDFEIAELSAFAVAPRYDVVADVPIGKRAEVIAAVEKVDAHIRARIAALNSEG